MKKVFLLISILILLFSAGCSNTAENSPSYADKSNIKKSGISPASQKIESSNINFAKQNSTSGTDYESESSTVSTANEHYAVGKNEAVKIAFKEAKKHESEFKLIITANALNNYTCEIDKRDGVTFYDIIFKNLNLKDCDPEIKTQIGIWVNANTGDVIKVLQYK